MYDTIVVGAGAAGCSAAIYATRYNLKTLMLGGPMPGGLITEALEVENYPGYLSIGGQELAKNFIDQAVKLGADYKTEIVESISIQASDEVQSNKDSGGNTPETADKKTSEDSSLKNKFEVKVSGGQIYNAKSLILAMGTHHRKLGVPGEEEFAGRGVSYCSTCDAPFFKNKTVAVIGGGNGAVEGVQDVAVHAEKAYIIYRSELRASPVYIDQMRAKKNIIEVPMTNVTEILGDKIVTEVVMDKEFNGSNRLQVDGVFIQIGYIPQREIPEKLGLKLTDYGYVKVNAGMGTSKEGIFCAGDLNDASNMLHQQVTSAAEGAIAAQSAYRYIQGVEYLIS